MNTLSIDDVLKKIDQRLSTLNMIDEDAPAVALDPLSEVGLYISGDRLLADLYRQYLESQRQYIQTVQQHGADSPMAEVAQDMSESSFSAMETRLIELRHEKELAARVEAVQTKQREEYVKNMQARQEAYTRRGIKQPQTLNETSQAKKAGQSASQKAGKKLPTENLMIWAMMAVSMTEAARSDYQHAARMSFSKAAA